MLSARPASPAEPKHDINPRRDRKGRRPSISGVARGCGTLPNSSCGLKVERGRMWWNVVERWRDR